MLTFLSRNKLALTLSKLALELLDAIIPCLDDLELAFLLSAILVHFSLSASAFAADLAQHSRISLLCRDGGGSTDDFQKLGVDRNDEVMLHGQRFIPLIDLLLDKVRELTANNSITNIDDPLKDE